MDCPISPDIELIRINKDAVVAICLAFPALINKSTGLKKIPPPIPTTPYINPIDPPIKNEIILGILLSVSFESSKDLNLKSNDSPANVKTIKSKISKKLLSNRRDPPIKAKGTDEIKQGDNNLILTLPALI